MGDNWDFLLSEFRNIGGIANNVCQKEGEYGRGIFSIDPKNPTRIFTPSKLMVKVDDICLQDNKLRIKKDKKYNQEIRNFFNFYQDNFSWGSGGKEITESFEKGLSLFNSNLKKLIKQNALVDIERRHQGNWDEVVKRQFLNARAVNFKKTFVIAPLWELVNHKVKSCPFIISDKGISTPDYINKNGEITHSYNNMSPIKRFFNYGFFSQETMIFSFPFSIKIENLDIYFSCKGMNLNNDSMTIERSGNTFFVEGLPIADINNPRLPNDYINEIFKRICNNYAPQDLLLKILQLNLLIRKKIINETNLLENKVVKTFIEMIQYEINLITSHD